MKKQTMNRGDNNEPSGLYTNNESHNRTLFAASRHGDHHECPATDGPKPHTGGPICSDCCPTVIIEGASAARMGDRLSCTGGQQLDTISGGEPSVLIKGRPAATVGNSTSHGGTISSGAKTVFIGHSSEGSASEPTCFDCFFVLRFSGSGTPARGHRYRIVQQDGSFDTGISDSLGRTFTSVTQQPERIKIEVLDLNDGIEFKNTRPSITAATTTTARDPKKDGVEVVVPKGVVALTFDDGPQDGTMDVLDALRETGTKATFFVTGINMSQPEKTKKKQKEILDLIRSEHHEIANHGWDHDPMYNSKHTEKDGSVRDGYREEYKKHGTTRVKDDFINNYKYISSLLPGAMTSRCRLPGDGRHWGPFVQMLERDLGLSHYGWNFEFATWKLGVKTWQGIYLEGRWATSSALPDTPGVILFHDRHWKGKKALLVSIINKLKEARDIVTLEDFDALTEIDKASSAYRTVKFFHKKGRKPDGELTMGI